MIEVLKEAIEAKATESESFKEIKPSAETSPSEARSFLDSEVDSGFYTDYKSRIDHTPSEDSSFGSWQGERGESKFGPSSETERGRAAIAKLEEKGLDGINYRNGEPDFSECAEAIVEIDNMTENRHNYEDAEGNEQLGNFAQADIQCAKQWTEEGRVKADGSTTWTERDVKTWRHENQCSWHECCDTKTMQLVSQDIHGSDKFSHSGGCAECRIRDAVDNGGGFDE